MAQRYSPAFIHALTRQLFEAVRAPRHVADAIAESLVEANLKGHDSHGILRIPGYLEGYQNRGGYPEDEPTFEERGLRTGTCDGAGGSGLYIAKISTERAIEKAKELETYQMVVENNGHIGRLGAYAEIAAKAGCIGIITTGSGGAGRGRILPFGGAKPALGTNPMAIGVPTGDESPFIIDYATSAIAAGKMFFAETQGKDLKEGCIVDKEGRPSVKVQDYYDGGNLLAFGKHKGYGMSLVVVLLGALSGGFDLKERSAGGCLIQIMDVEAFTPLSDYQQGVRAFLDSVKDVPPAAGFDQVLVPGDPEFIARKDRLVNGIEVWDMTIDEIKEWAEKLDVSWDEDSIEASDRARYA